MQEILIKSIGEERYLHCLRVKDIAVALAEKYNVDKNKVETAAILHDCAKFKDKSELLKRAAQFDIIIDNVMKKNLELIHAPIGAKIAEIEYGIKDKEILNAIQYHTTARENMTILDKIIYIADYIEPERNFEDVEMVRNLTFKDIDLGISLALDNTIKFLIKMNRVIHLDTIKARNYFKIYEK